MYGTQWQATWSITCYKYLGITKMACPRFATAKTLKENILVSGFLGMPNSQMFHSSGKWEFGYKDYPNVQQMKLGMMQPVCK